MSADSGVAGAFPRIVRIVVLPVLLIALAIFAAVVAWPHVDLAFVRSANLKSAGSLGLACRFYAQDHRGNFPRDVWELGAPAYAISPEVVESLRYWRDDDFKEPFRYFAGLTDLAWPQLPLFSGPVDGPDGKRIVVTVDMSKLVVNEEQYEVMLAQYGEWMTRNRKEAW